MVLPEHFVVRRFYNYVKAFASFAEGYEVINTVSNSTTQLLYSKKFFLNNRNV